MDALHRQDAVLVVDANPALLATLESLLQGSDYSCIAAEDTVTALCALVEHEPHTIIVDADTGPLQLWQFCALVREHPLYRDTRLVVSCNRDDALARARADAAGAAAFLRKPFAADEVLQVLAVAESGP